MPVPSPTHRVLLPSGGRTNHRLVAGLQAARLVAKAHLRVKALPRPLARTDQAEFYAAPSGQHVGIEAIT